MGAGREACFRFTLFNRVAESVERLGQYRASFMLLPGLYWLMGRLRLCVEVWLHDCARARHLNVTDWL